MRKRPLVRLQLVFLAAIVLLLLYRSLSGPPGPDGFVVLDEIEVSDLEHRFFELDEPAVVAVMAAGSFEEAPESTAGARALAAYGWILHRETRTVVWRMQPETVRAERGTLAAVNDTIRLGPGGYDVYFTSYGNSFGRSRESGFGFLRQDGWTGDAEDWVMALQRLDTPPAKDQGWPTPVRVNPPLEPIWSVVPADEGNRQFEYLFEATRPVSVVVTAMGELPEMDYGWLAVATEEAPLWELTMETSEPAGGAAANRQARVELALAPGIYRAVYRTDAAHHPGSWRANPPFEPNAWGMTLATAPSDAEAVRPFDPWAAREPVVGITEVPNNTERSVTFTVTTPVTLIAAAVGEITDDNNRYDYGWITRGEEVVWKMNWEATQPAGGHRNNRQEVTFLRLGPGTYTAHFSTDGSHAFGNWSNGAPDHPARWGLALFAAAADLSPEAIQDVTADVPVDVAPTRPADAPEALPPAAPPPTSTEAAIHEAPLGNEVRISETLIVAEPTTFRIYSVGEITLSGRYDHGWIEKADTGERVWEMTWQNTQPAGGADRNRRFDGLVTLQPGTYTVRFDTDFSHAYDDFGDEAPDAPEHWGITIQPHEPPTP